MLGLLLGASCLVHAASIHIIRSHSLDVSLYLGSPVCAISADSRLTCAQSCAAQTGCTASMWIQSANMCNMYADYRRNSTQVVCSITLSIFINSWLMLHDNLLRITVGEKKIL